MLESDNPSVCARSCQLDGQLANKTQVFFGKCVQRNKPVTSICGCFCEGRPGCIWEENKVFTEMRGKKYFGKNNIATNSNLGSIDEMESTKSPDIESTIVICSCNPRFKAGLDWDAISDNDRASLVIILNDKFPNMPVALDSMVWIRQENKRAMRWVIFASRGVTQDSLPCREGVIMSWYMSRIASMYDIWTFMLESKSMLMSEESEFETWRMDKN